MFDSPRRVHVRSAGRRRSLLMIAGAAAAALAVAGCGNDVPSNGVAKVGDEVISKDEFNRWLKTAASGQQAQLAGGQAAAPDPPDFERCVASRQRQPVPQGATKPTAVQLKQQCKQEYETLRDQVMQFLIQAQWVQQEAEARGAEVSDAQVKRQFEDQKKQSFPNDKAYREFLKTSGMSEQDILFRVKLDALQNELRKKVTQGEGKVTKAEIESYYEKNKSRFAQPERRDLRVVLTKTEAKAKQAQKALDDRKSFNEVSKKFSIDEASKSKGGKLPDVAKGQQEKALDEAVFKAKQGELTGPIKTQFGWYVFEVTDVKPASQQTLEQSRATIQNILKTEGEQKALEDFIKDFREKYKDETKCREGFVVAECENAPKESTDTGPASGGQPGGAPAQPTPQGGAPGAPPTGVPPGGAPQGAPPGGAPQGVPPGAAPQGGAPPGAPQAPPQVPPGG